MSYLSIVTIVFGVIWCVFFALLFHYIFFTVVGIFSCKKFPHTEEKKRYGIVISGRNEEAVIGNLIKSIALNDYPQDKIKVFVCAHNCTDRTAEIARQYGATVYEYNDPAAQTLGYAYHYTFQKIEEEFGTKSFDGFLIMNADNILTKNYLSKMNDAFLANEKKRVIISYRNSKNFGSNYMSCLYGIFFIAACRFESRGRTVCGCSTRVSGTGYLFNSELLKDGWNYLTLTEDWEFSADRIAEGTKIYYCDEAEFFDEQPTTVPIMWRQRLRWAKGHMIVFFTRFTKLVKSFFTPVRKGGHENKFSMFDIAMSILPLGVMSVSLSILQTVCIAFSPLFGYNVAEVWKYYGIFCAVSFAVSYFLTVISGVILVILERRRRPKVKPVTMIGALMLWPFFLGLNIILDCIALFKKNVAWKPIPHDDVTSIEDIQK